MYKRQDMGLPLSENAKWMKERLVSIMEFRKRSRPWSLAACIMSVSYTHLDVYKRKVIRDWQALTTIMC